jgi:hypothetical protein
MNIIAFVLAVIAFVMFLWDGKHHADGTAHRCLYVLGLAVAVAAFVAASVITGVDVISWNL